MHSRVCSPPKTGETSSQAIGVPLTSFAQKRRKTARKLLLNRTIHRYSCCRRRRLLLRRIALHAPRPTYLSVVKTLRLLSAPSLLSGPRSPPSSSPSPSHPT